MRFLPRCHSDRSGEISSEAKLAGSFLKSRESLQALCLVEVTKDKSAGWLGSSVQLNQGVLGCPEKINEQADTECKQHE